MPELPEVEVTAQSLRDQIAGATFVGWKSSGKRLRHPMPRQVLETLKGQPLLAVGRRAKYVLMEFSGGWLAAHLGMSGAMRCCAPAEPSVLHDHLRLQFCSGEGLPVDVVFHDPRRFGSFQWIDRTKLNGRDIGTALGESAVGMEPLGTEFNGDYLFAESRGRNVAIKQWLMNGQVVVGVGNIYACEALFSSGIHPARKAGSISRQRFAQLAQEIQTILSQAIRAGGSTISDFYAPDGRPGRYGQSHQVYGREGEPCPRCDGASGATGATIRRMVQGQRSTFYCRLCQR